MNYAVLDVETTGGKYNEEGIIEIAVYRFDGKKVTDTFISLVNPEKEIHFYVQKLTGITQKTVRTAPKFYELAKRLVEITEDATIVAHNAAFDYRIIRTEFSRLGFDFQRPTLDTLSLSKMLIPNLASYSLGNLCTDLGIPLSDRHRADGDAWATVKLFQLLLAKDSQKGIIQSSIKPIKSPSFNKKILYLLEDLPQEPGVFYLHDEQGKILYIDKDNNISNKARQLLTGRYKKARELQQKTENVSFELTGNEIIAAIKVRNETLINIPEYRPKKDIDAMIYGIFREETKEGLHITPINKKNKKKVLMAFSSLEKAKSFLTRKVEEAVSAEDHSLQKLILELALNEETLLLIGSGRTLSEKSFLLMEKGSIKGYGFYSLHSQIKDLERIMKIMTPASGTAEILLQIRNKLFISEKLEKIVL